MDANNTLMEMALGHVYERLGFDGPELTEENATRPLFNQSMGRRELGHERNLALLVDKFK
jgi:hypothetical protein